MVQKRTIMERNGCTEQHPPPVDSAGRRLLDVCSNPTFQVQFRIPPNWLKLECGPRVGMKPGARGDGLPPTDESESDPRANERSNVFLSATLYTKTQSFPVRVRNFSASGALLDGTNLPGEGSAISLRRAHLAVDGEIVWEAQELRGVRFSAEIDVQEWVKLRGHAGQQHVDQSVAAFRRGTVQTVKPELAEKRPAYDSIEAISVALEEVCEPLANSATLTDDVADELLRLEAITQRLHRFVKR